MLHTKGPWHYGRCKDFANVGGSARLVPARGWFIGAEGRYDIAEVLLTASQSAAEQEANAKLMSAAPDLLTALKDLLGCCELNLDEMEDDTRRAIDAAREAVHAAASWRNANEPDEVRR